MNEKVLFEKLDKIILILEKTSKEPSFLARVVNGAATGAGLLGILSAVDIIKSWLGG